MNRKDAAARAAWEWFRYGGERTEARLAEIIRGMFAAHMLQWQKERPTELGAYWIRETTGYTRVVGLRRGLSGLRVDIPGHAENYAISDEAFDEWEWAGPLEPPA
jgi:hypothetical protein